MSERRDIVHAPRNRRLKLATQELFDAAGGQDAAAEHCSTDWRKIDQQHLSNCKHLNTAHFLRINEAAELEDFTAGQAGWPHVTRAMAKRQGFALVRLPEARFDATIWARQAAKLLKEGGDVIEGLGARLENDGDLDPGEAGSLIPEVDQLIEIGIALREALKRRAGGEF